MRLLCQLGEALHPPPALSCLLVSDTVIIASLARDEAVLSFPYDERLRQLLRAIPGRRWDPLARVWCIPLDPERAQALARLFASLPSEPRVSPALARAIERRRERRRHDECVLDLARPDQNWWLGFATDAEPECVSALLGHPDAYSLPAIGRALIPLDGHSSCLIDALRERRSWRAAQRRRSPRAARAPDAPSRAECPPASRGRERVGGWRGNIDVTGSREEPVFLLLGDISRLPPALRERAVSAPGGAALPLTLDSWSLIEGQLSGWISDAAERCVRALKEGRHAAPRRARALAGVDGEETFVLVPGHDATLLDEFAALSGALPVAPRRAPRAGQVQIPAIRADPFCVPELDRFLAAASRSGWTPRRSRSCRRSASSTPMEPASWRSPPPPTHRFTFPDSPVS